MLARTFRPASKGKIVKVSAMIRLSPGAEPHTRLLSHMAEYARRIEASGFPGIWVGDSMGRGRPADARSAHRAGGARRGDRARRARHRGASSVVAPPDRARPSLAVGEGLLRRPAPPRGRQRRD